MCSLCRVGRTTRNHLSTKRHRRALNPIYRTIGKPERRRYIPRDWEAEAREAEFNAWLTDIGEPTNNTHYEG
jgi:hypothetical protein